MDFEYKGKIKPEFLSKALKMYDTYKADKEEVNKRIKENELQYRKWSILNDQPTVQNNEPVTTTAFIFSAIENKYADAVDNFPAANILEREPSDEKAAKILSKVIPLQLDISGFKETYKQNWRKKLKHGTAVYGVFYNQLADDIQIKPISALCVYCDMHIQDVQDSQFLFIVNAVDNDALKEQYPKYEKLFEGDATVEGYTETNTAYDRTEVVDCYYKKTDGAVHMMKLVKGYIIDSTEDTPGYENGIYQHGLYPVVFDVLYPAEDCPFGYGAVDVIRNQQKYIDKLDSIILKNSMMAGQERWFAKENGAINMDEFTDWSNPIVHVQGSLDEMHLRKFQADALPAQVLQHRENKIEELKEVIGNRDFQQGGTSGGVTAASAITVLQNAGEKLSRALIDDSYDSYKKIVTMCIELMREFYKEPRIYRITNEQSQKEFAELSSDMLGHEETKTDHLGFPVETEWHRAEFDVSIIPQRQNPFTKEMNNQTIMTLYSAGFFNPQNAEASMMALGAMQFDGKEKVMEKLQSLQEQQQQQQAAEQAAQAQQVTEQVPMQEAQPTQMPGTGESVFGADGEEYVPIDIGAMM